MTALAVKRRHSAARRHSGGDCADAARSRAARIGYLGPPGTFTEEALLAQIDLAGGELVAMDSMAQVLDAVDDGALDLGFVAVENSTGGGVDVSLDGLIFGHELLIRHEFVHDIRLSLLALSGTRLHEVRKVVSFPNALTQCRGFLRRELGPVQEVAVPSTAEAARRISHEGEPGTAAVGTSAAGRLYGLDVLASDIQDGRDANRTRFVLVSRPESGIPPATGHDKTTVVCFQHADRPGSLRAILEQFAIRGVNVVKLESRPTKRQLGEYCFFIDLTGHISDAAVAGCLRALGRELPDIKFLGSYPSADQPAQAPNRGTRLSGNANRWIASLCGAVRPEACPSSGASQHTLSLNLASAERI